MRWNGRKTALAGLLAFVLLLGSLAVGSSAHADGPTAVFYGYVATDPGVALPKRVRAISEHGAVCGSADITPIGTVGFYALAVMPNASKEGCPVSGETVRLALVYGLIDEAIVVGTPAPFRPGEVTLLHLIRRSSDVARSTLLP